MLATWPFEFERNGNLVFMFRFTWMDKMQMMRTRNKELRYLAGSTRCSVATADLVSPPVGTLHTLTKIR